MNNPDYFEREYRGNGSIPNIEQYFVDWRENSAATRQQLTGHLNLHYGPGEKETLDLFPAQNSTRLMVFIHGGYWHSMDKADYSYIAGPFVRAGISAAVINYALCPTVTIGAIVEQCQQAVAWLHRNAHGYGVSGERMIITGHSAGGHLAAMMFATDWTAYGMPSEAISGGIALSGLFFLEPMLSIGLNATLNLTPDSIQSLSPVYQIPTVRAPLIAAVGELESYEFKRQTLSIGSAWPETCQATMIVAGRHHFDILDDLTNLGSSLWQKAAGMLA